MQSLEKEKVHKRGNNAVKGLKTTPKKSPWVRPDLGHGNRAVTGDLSKPGRSRKEQISLGRAACAQSLGTGGTARAPSGFSGFLGKMLSLETS